MDNTDLYQFLEAYPEEVQDIAIWLRNFICDLYPQCNELVYDNYNALAFGPSLTEKAGDVFCSIAVFAKHVNFGFNRGSEINDPDGILIGKGSLYRYITVKNINQFPESEIKLLVKDAYDNAMSRLKGKPTCTGISITKSISPVKKRPK